MAEVFANSGENTSNVVVPPPQLQGVFIPGIDNPLAVNGFGLVTPFGGGSTSRKYSDFGSPAEVSSQSTQLNDLMNAFVPGGVGGAGYNLEGLVGPQGIPGINGVDGVTTLLHLYGAPNSSFLTALPHNLDLINDLGTATDKLIYTNAYNTYTGVTWTERQPAGDSNEQWECVASDSDGSNLIAGEDSGRLYTSSDSGANWTERQPTGPQNQKWRSVASDADGSHLIACVRGARVYTSANSGVDWTERNPTEVGNKDYECVASDSDGSNLIAVVETGRLYTSANSGVDWTERQPAGAADKEWDCVASDDDGSHLIACEYNGRIWTSADSGATWSERRPAGDANKSWRSVASDDDGSHLIACEYNGRIWTSADSGATWSERRPLEDTAQNWNGVASDSDGSNLIAYISTYETGRLYTSEDYGVTWTTRELPSGYNGYVKGVASDSDGSNLIAGEDSGRLYTGIESPIYSEATWAESALTSAGRALVDDADAAAQATTLGLGTEDRPTWVGATLSGLTQGSVLFAGVGAVISEDNTKLNWDDTLNRLDITSTLRIKNSSGDAVFYVDDDEMYFTASLVIPIEAGMSMGLLLSLTYAAP